MGLSEGHQPWYVVTRLADLLECEASTLIGGEEVPVQTKEQLTGALKILAEAYLHSLKVTEQMLRGPEQKI